MKKNKILIIGGAGYIGSHVTYDLNDRNYKTVVLDDLSSGFIKNVDVRSEFIKGSFFDQKLLKKILDDVDTVIHLAALKDAGESMVLPKKYLVHNIILD